MDKYNDIRNHDRYRLKYHQPMPVQSRAVQFSPFAALTGYDEEISEAARFTDCCEKLTEDELFQLNQHFQMLLETASEHPQIMITYFEPDRKKVGGMYASYKGQFRFFDEEENKLKFTDGKEISVGYITGIEFCNEKIEEISE